MSHHQRWLALTAVAIALAGLVVAGCSGRSGDEPSPGADTTEGGEHQQVFAIEGMTCEGCVSTVTMALKGLPGVESVQVSLAHKQATVTGDPQKVTEQAVIAAVEEAGYKAQPAATGADGTR
ncbi:MAG: heavy-metal-associated domain-containing protein [Pirellulales bacterium]|nr:heavy-metal-associated domain-containing protein [Pirellulales bacterium]